MEICWLCDTMIDVDESAEGFPEAHADCHYDLLSGGRFSAVKATHEAQAAEKMAEANAYLESVESFRRRLDATA